MTLLDAKAYRPEEERKKTVRWVGAVVVIVVLAAVIWFNRFWPQKHIADTFFAAIQKQDFETAYGIYFHDPQWKQHKEQYAKYPFNEFWQDWGPGGQWGAVKKYEVYGTSNCPRGGSGVVVDFVVNDRAQHAQVYVDRHDKTISTPPCDLEFH